MTSRYKVLPESDLVEVSAPAESSVNAPTDSHLEQLTAAICAALTAMPRFELAEERVPPATLEAAMIATPVPVVAAAPITASASPPPEIPAPVAPVADEPFAADDNGRWVLLALTLAIVVALVSAGSSVFERC